MATEVKLEFINEGFREILRGAPVAQVVDEVTASILARAGAGYKSHSFIGWYGSRYIGVVETGDFESRLDQAKNKTLQTAVNG